MCKTQASGVQAFTWNGPLPGARHTRKPVSQDPSASMDPCWRPVSSQNLEPWAQSFPTLETKPLPAVNGSIHACTGYDTPDHDSFQIDDMHTFRMGGAPLQAATETHEARHVIHLHRTTCCYLFVVLTRLRTQMRVITHCPALPRPSTVLQTIGVGSQLKGLIASELPEPPWMQVVGRLIVRLLAVSSDGALIPVACQTWVSIQP